MRISMISFTENGMILSEKIKENLKGFQIQLFTKCSYVPEKYDDVEQVRQPISVWAKEQMEQKNALVFVGACGIAVRAIAPHIVSKLVDSPVLVIDEKGKYVIPILSGHFGGANELAVWISKKIGAEPVITTATDINQKFAVDIFAKKNNLFIVNKDGIAKVSAKILRGEKITFSIENGHLKNGEILPEEILLVSYPPEEMVDVVVSSEDKEFDVLLTLKPREYVVGAGCRKGKEPAKFAEFVNEMLEKAEIEKHKICTLASIDVKKDEQAMLKWSKENHIPFLTYDRGELEELDGKFQESEFVKQTVGVGNVCERAALKAAGTGGKLVLGKYAEDGMTIAIAKREWRVTFDEE